MQHVLQESAGSLHFAGTVYGEVLAYGQQIVYQLVVGIHTGGYTVEIGVVTKKGKKIGM